MLNKMPKVTYYIEMAEKKILPYFKAQSFSVLPSVIKTSASVYLQSFFAHII